MRRSAVLLLPVCLWFFTACAVIPIFKPAAKPPRPAPSVTQTRAQMLMGTMVKITVVAPNDLIAQAALTAGFQEIRRLEQLLSTWIETSELSRVNQAAGQEPVDVSEETF